MYRLRSDLTIIRFTAPKLPEELENRLYVPFAGALQQDVQGKPCQRSNRVSQD